MDTKDSKTHNKVTKYIDSFGNEQTVKDTLVLIEMIQNISSHEPILWNVGTIGFDTYHYKYESRREGDGHIIGFYPRKGKITISDGWNSKLPESIGKVRKVYQYWLLYTY